MFSRIKDALDRTIAEEQARLRAADTSSNTNKPAAAPPSADPAKTTPSNGGPAHPDPAVFDAALHPKDDADGEVAKGGASNAASELNTPPQAPSQAQAQDGDDGFQPPELPPHVKSKLRRLERLELNFQGTWSGLLYGWPA
ncbi:hypothetical protein F4803DRAFT_522479 [Xylaria telfairii]|nr:hypothetical protein F4803DRAFT_522479 [Xylaria telfairii]